MIHYHNNNSHTDHKSCRTHTHNNQHKYNKNNAMNKINSDPFFRTASESALRAINHPECQKLKVPKKKYETWKALILEFDPSKSLN